MYSVLYLWVIHWTAQWKIWVLWILLLLFNYSRGGKELKTNISLGPIKEWARKNRKYWRIMKLLGNFVKGKWVGKGIRSNCDEDQSAEKGYLRKLWSCGSKVKHIIKTIVHWYFIWKHLWNSCIFRITSSVR